MSPNWKLRGRWGEQINNFSKQDYCCCICQGQDAWAPISKYGTTNSGGELSWCSRETRRSCPSGACQGGREGPHQCTRSRLTEKLVSRGRLAKRAAHQGRSTRSLHGGRAGLTRWLPVCWLMDPDIHHEQIMCGVFFCCVLEIIEEAFMSPFDM